MTFLRLAHTSALSFSPKQAASLTRFAINRIASPRALVGRRSLNRKNARRKKQCQDKYQLRFSHTNLHRSANRESRAARADYFEGSPGRGRRSKAVKSASTLMTLRPSPRRAGRNFFEDVSAPPLLGAHASRLDASNLEAFVL
jgi:hypothetical protein